MNVSAVQRLSKPIFRTFPAHNHCVPTLIRQNHNASTIHEPRPSGSSSPDISFTHPKDPGNTAPYTPSSSKGNGTSEPIVIPLHPPAPSGSKLPLPQQARHQQYANPPFHTHQFFVALEKSFPTETSRSLMRATRALLVDRVGRVNREALTIKDLESVRTFPSCPNNR